MIVSHAQRLIFVKTKKVGGTSFEIALSKFCGPDDIITRIAPGDERLRQSLGYRGPQNGQAGSAEFSQHMTAAQIKARLPAEVWAGYRKITILRNPFDAVISRYYWDGGAEGGADGRADGQLTLEGFVRAHPEVLTENLSIAPLQGPARLDHYLRYDRLATELQALGLGHVAETMAQIRTKDRFRPAAASVAEVFAGKPALVAFIAAQCAEEIAQFGFDVPASGQAGA